MFKKQVIEEVPKETRPHWRLTLTYSPYIIHGNTNNWYLQITYNKYSQLRNDYVSDQVESKFFQDLEVAKEFATTWGAEFKEWTDWLQLNTLDIKLYV